MKAFPTFLFFASFLLVSSLLFGIYGCTPPPEIPVGMQQSNYPDIR